MKHDPNHKIVLLINYLYILLDITTDKKSLL